jgi:hypothetical protein
MKIKIFVDWTGARIMNQKEGEAELASQLNNKDDYEDYRGTYLNDIIEDWLKKKPEVHYSEFYKKLFDLSAEERAEIEAKCRESYKEQVEEDFFDDWEEFEIDV